MPIKGPQPTNVQRSEAKSAAGAALVLPVIPFPLSFQDEPGSGDPVGDRPRRRLRRGGVLRGVHLQRVVTPAIPLAK